MSLRNLKQRIRDREYVESARSSAGWVGLELLCIAGIAGAGRSSWLVFFGVLFLLALILQSPLAPVLYILFSLFWAGVTYLLSSGQGLSLQILLTVGAFFVSMGVHQSAGWWLRDD